MKMKQRLTVTVSLVLSLALLPLAPAHACSCAFGDPRDAIDEADAAVIATYVSQRPVDPTKPHLTAIYTFKVDEEIKGTFGDTVEVRSHTQSTACALGVEEGEPTGLLLYLTKSGAWSSNSCSQMSPEQMREAASPLPAPTAEPPGLLAVGGSFHNEQSVLLDDVGEIVHYGGPGAQPESEVVELDACPGSQTLIEVTDMYRQRSRLFVRNTETFEIEHVVELPFGRRPYRQQHVSSVACNDEGASSIHVFASDFEYSSYRRSTSYLMEIGPKGIESLTKGEARYATFMGDGVFLNEGRYGRRIVRLDLDSGTRTFVAKVPPAPGPFAPSPDGTMLAAVAEGKPVYDAPPSRVVIIRLLDHNRVISRSLHQQYLRGEMLWLNDDHLVFLADYNTRASRIYDASLTVIARLKGWAAYEPEMAEGRIFGLTFDYDDCFCARVIEYDIEKEESRTISELPTTVAYALLTL